MLRRLKLTIFSCLYLNSPNLNNLEKSEKQEKHKGLENYRRIFECVGWRLIIY